MEVGVKDAAAVLGVSQQRIRNMISDRRLTARRVAGRYLIDEAQLAGAPAVSRPMSPRIAWAFISLLSGRRPVDVSPAELSRLRQKRVRLVSEEQPERLLRSWLARRAEHRRYSVAPGDLAALARDARVLRSGVSDPRSGMSSGGEFEGYLACDRVDSVVDDYLLSRVGNPNVLLHVIADGHWLAKEKSAPLGLVVADLADRQSPREDNKVNELLPMIGSW